MAQRPKSPQEKKHLAYDRDHVQQGEHSTSRRTWRKKKIKANREFRRKSDQLFAGVKTGMDVEDVSQIAGDVTVARIQKSVTRKRLHKWGPATLGEVVLRNIEKREKRANRRVLRRTAKYDKVALAIATLTSLEGERLVEFVRRFAFLYRGGDPVGYQKMYLSRDPLDQAFRFVCELQRGWGSHREIICESEELKTALDAWAIKANRILARDRRALAIKTEEKRKAGMKISGLRRGQVQDL